MGLFGDLIDLTGDAIGTLAGIAVSPLAIAIGCSERLIRRAIDSGCKTEKEIREWVRRNS